MNKLIDLTGEKFNRWTVIERAFKNNKYNKPLWICKCDCGTIKEQTSVVLKSGNSKSCGCLVKDTNTKHGMYKTRLNKEYRGLKQRCYNSKNSRYEYYGGRGINICDEWLGKEGFVNFMNWSLENGYTDELTLDRIDSNGNYEPSNCRWETMKVQARNRRIRNTNKSGVNGVYFRKEQNKYRTSILDNEGKKVNLGQYKTLEEATEVRKQAELKYWGFTNIK